MPKSKSDEAPTTIPRLEVIKLWTRAGGQCEFNSCAENLLVDSLSLKEANFSNIAHIVARTKTGPRGSDSLPIKERNKVDNLMLSCQKHHTLIDSKQHEYDYPKELLLSYKSAHENRIKTMTAIRPDPKRLVLRMRANVNGEIVDVHTDHIDRAIHPNYPADRDGVEVDLTGLSKTEDQSFWVTGQKIIDESLELLYRRSANGNTIERLAVFGLASIPHLFYLGYSLSNKIETDLYQFHRDTKDWTWKETANEAEYELSCLRGGTNETHAVLVLSLSGSLAISDLPSGVVSNRPVYEIRLKNLTPNPTFLNTRDDLNKFKRIYQEFLGLAKANQPQLTNIAVFPAIPAPIANLFGQELLKKVHPTMDIFDNNKKAGGFNHVFSIN